MGDREAGDERKGNTADMSDTNIEMCSSLSIHLPHQSTRISASISM